MTDDEIKQARALCEAATPGPWYRHPSVLWGTVTTKEEGRGEPIAQAAPSNGDFIAAARELLPKALDEIERLRNLGDRIIPMSFQEGRRAAIEEARPVLEECYKRLPRCSWEGYGGCIQKCEPCKMIERMSALLGRE